MASGAIDIEVSRYEANVPFRAAPAHLHHTWAQTFRSFPERYLRPQTLSEIQKIVKLARRCRRRLVVVGSGHSPSDLTCSSSWMVNLDEYSQILHVDETKKTILMQAGIRLKDLNLRAKDYGLTMPNLGSIDAQSIAGAIATATHGSSTRHGLLSQSVRSLRIVLADGSAVWCSGTENTDLFRAALVSLGALGIIVEVEFEMISNTAIEWFQTLRPLEYILDNWEKTLWYQSEFVRVWWFPYNKRAMVWHADKSEKPYCAPRKSWYGGLIGYYTYLNLLWLANKFPRILPLVEWFVFGIQYGFRVGRTASAVEELSKGLLMDCLFSQFVNEWAIPLHKGPEAIRRLSAWLNHDQATSGIPFPSDGVYIHAPIEVRVSNTTSSSPRPYLDNTVADGPTLYLNATLYRPYHLDPPCRHRYYEAFEWLMKQLGGRPHWAKNFATVSRDDFAAFYSDKLTSWLQIREKVDPDGMFTGAWHRRNLLAEDRPTLPLEEQERTILKARGGGLDWFGEQALGDLVESGSEESFDILHSAEAESQLLAKRSRSDDDGNDDE